MRDYVRFFKFFVPAIVLSMLIHIGIFRLICGERLYISIAAIYLVVFAAFLATRIIDSHLFRNHPYGVLINYSVSAVIRIAVVVVLVLPLLNPEIRTKYNVTAEVLNLLICYLVQLTAYNAIFSIRRLS